MRVVGKAEFASDDSLINPIDDNQKSARDLLFSDLEGLKFVV